MSFKLEEIKQELISKLDDDNLLVIDGRDSVKVSMKIAGVRHEFEIRAKRDAITVDCSKSSIMKEKSYEFENANELVNDFVNLQKIVNEVNQSLVQSVFSSMFE